MYQASSNAFLALFRWARRQEENYFTECFFVILKNIFEDNPKEGERILAFLSGLVDAKSPYDLSNPQLHLQAITENEGTPDGEITTKDCLLVIEAKVTAVLSTNQFEAYKRHLNIKNAAYKKLILLTHDRINPSQEEDSVRYLRWYEIGDLLDEIRNSGNLNRITARLLSDFLALLEFRGLAITKVTSDLTQAIKYFLYERQQGNIGNTRIRNLSSLRKYEKMAPLLALLQHMEEAASNLRTSPKVILDSGKHDGGWIGYNINSMEYFFVVELKADNVIYLQAYKRKINDEGRKYMKQKYGEVGDSSKWWVKKKIDNGFFNKSKRDQLLEISDFL
jgi:hypothetical protein